MGLTSPGFGIYITAGWPEPRKFMELVSSLERCADFIEVGLPSQRPIYDGPTIRATHREALERGVNLGRAIELIGDASSVTSKPIIAMGYMGDVKVSLASVVRPLSLSNVQSLLLPDLLFEHFNMVELYLSTLAKYGMKPSYFVSSKFPHGVLARLALDNPLFIYLGLQPATGVKLPVSIHTNISIARRLVGDTYLVAGFSIRDPETVEQVIKSGASAAVVGSEIARRLVENGLDSAVSTACRLSAPVRELRGG